MDAINWAAVAAGFASGIIGGMGLGGGAVLLIYLSVFAGVQQLTAQGINLIFFLPIGLIAVIIYAFQKKIEWKPVAILAATGAAGSLGGSYLVGLLGGDLTTKLFAVLLIAFGLHEVFFRKQKTGLQSGASHGILKSNKCSVEVGKDGKDTAE